MQMKVFFLKLIVYAALCGSIFLLIISRADGRTDAFYLRFTTSPQNNLILGTSRSAQAIQPEVLRGVLNRSFLNYSFTIAHSPFGPVYLNSIEKKLNPEVRDGIFIIAVDPWSITDSIQAASDTSKFGENNLFLATTDEVNVNPNLEYLLENFQGKFYKTVLPPNKNMVLHTDGWLEVSVDMDSISRDKRLRQKLSDYEKKMIPQRTLSEIRLAYLIKTIQFLKSHGSVYLVRLPVEPEIFGLEQAFMPNFDELMHDAIHQSNGYWDMSNRNASFQYVDGSHLHKDSGRAVSDSIARWIDLMSRPNPAMNTTQ